MSARANVPVSVEFISKFEALERDVQRLHRRLHQQERQVRGLRGQWNQFKGGVKDVFSSMLNPLGAVTAAIGVAIAKTKEWIDEQIKLYNASKRVADTLTRYTGEAYRATSATTKMVRSVEELSGTSAEDITKSINALSKAFGEDFETASKKYHRVIARNINETREFSKQIEEYSAILGDAGISSDQFLKLIEKGMFAGIYDDKAIDFLKEVTIQLSEMPDKTKKAIEQLDNAGEIFEAINSGDYDQAFKLIAEGLDETGMSAQEVYRFLQNIGVSLAEDIGTSNAISMLRADVQGLEKDLRLSTQQMKLYAEELRKVRKVGEFGEDSKSERQFIRRLKARVREVQTLEGAVISHKIYGNYEGEVKANEALKERVKLLQLIRSEIGGETFDTMVGENLAGYYSESEAVQNYIKKRKEEKQATEEAAKAARKKAEEERKAAEEISKARAAAEKERKRIEREGLEGSIKNAAFKVNQLRKAYEEAATNEEAVKIKTELELAENFLQNLKGEVDKLPPLTVKTTTIQDEGLAGDWIATKQQQYLQDAENAIAAETFKQNEKRAIEEQTINTTNNLVNAGASFFEIAKQRELQAAGKNSKRKEAIAKKYARKQQNTAAIMTAINGQVAAMKAIAELGPIAGGIAAAGIAIDTIASIAEIKSQKFATGGIVGGNSYHGDKIPALLNSREMVLNMGQQKNLFDMINSGLNPYLSGGVVDFRIEGSDLVGVLDNQSRQTNSFR